MSLYDDFRRAWPILLLIPVALAAWRRRWRRSSITSALLFVPPLVPVLGFASFDFQYFSTVADHYVYLAMAGPAFLIATLAARAPRLGRIAIACVLVLLTIRSAYVASAWADTTSLCNQALGADPGNTAANLLLGDRDAKLSRDESASGDANSARQHFDSAMKHFQTILSNRPDDGVVLRDMGSLQLQFGQLEPAAQALARSVHERPDDPDAHQNLAAALDQLGLVKEAAAQFATAVSIKPDDAEIRANYGNFLTRHGSFDAAIPELQAALAIDPTNAVAQRDMRYIRQTETPATTPSIGKP
jgi:tetratricopeptide (TPR) repeat protein